MSQRAQRVSAAVMHATPFSSASRRYGRERRAETEDRRLDLRERGMVSPKFATPRYLQVYVEISAAVGCRQCLHELGPMGIAVRIADLQLGQAAPQAGEVGANARSVAAVKGDDFVDPVTE